MICLPGAEGSGGQSQACTRSRTGKATMARLELHRRPRPVDVSAGSGSR